MRKLLVIALIAIFASGALAFAAWWAFDSPGEPEAAGEPASALALEGGSSPGEEGAAEVTAAGETAAAGAEYEASALPSGDDTAQATPTERYVTETQRHQNFFVALAEGNVRRLDAVATDYQPPGDPNTSYMYFTLTTSDGAKHNGTMVLKYETGMWRIAAVRQLAGSLGGGTDYAVPANFEEDLARELAELQEFLAKMAQGRLDYMVVDSVSRPSDVETVLDGRVVGVGGRIENTRMVLRKDYGIWHLTDITAR